jgi:hypothetical protein
MFVAEVRVLRPIMWREVTVCYVPDLEQHEAQQVRLLEAYGFTCACELCAHPAPACVHSDALRAQLEGLMAHGNELPNARVWAWARDRCTAWCARAAGHLHHITPTLPFHSAGSHQHTNLTSGTGPAFLRLLKVHKSSTAQRATVSVGGFLNVGKSLSSLINTQTRQGALLRSFCAGNVYHSPFDGASS